MTGLREVSFEIKAWLPFPQPKKMTAFESGISIEVEESEGKETAVFLSPRHINTILSMAEIWWLEAWEALYEERT